MVDMAVVVAVLEVVMEVVTVEVAEAAVSS